MTLTRNNFPFFIILLISAATLGSCDESETVIPKGRPITFTTEDNWGDEPTQSRATKTVSKEGTLSVEVTTEPIPHVGTRATTLTDNFGVFIDYSSKSTAFMKNMEVESNGTYENTLYWPSEALSFYAYSPYVAKTTDKSYINEETATVTYQLDGTQDIMWATPVLNQSSGTVALEFQHKMSALKFKLVNNSSYERTLDNIIIKNTATSATLDIKDGTFTTKGTGDLNLAETQTAAQGVTMETRTYYIAPSSTALSLTFDIDGTPYKSEDIGLNITPAANTSYTVTITINEKEVEYEVIDADTWQGINGFINSNSDKKIRIILKNDIDFSAAKINRIETFDGVLEGNDCTLSNFTIGVSSPSAGEINYAIIKNITKNGVVKNLNIKGATINCYGKSAILVCQNQGTIIGCKVEKCKQDVYAIPDENVVYDNQGTIIGCMIANGTTNRGGSTNYYSGISSGLARQNTGRIVACYVYKSSYTSSYKAFTGNQNIVGTGNDAVASYYVPYTSNSSGALTAYGGSTSDSWDVAKTEMNKAIDSYNNTPGLSNDLKCNVKWSGEVKDNASLLLQ